MIKIMTLAKSKTEHLYSLEEYLKIDRNSTAERYEYVGGEIHAMAGESGEHGDISINLVLEIASQLKGKNCRTRSKDTKVRSGMFPLKRPLRKGMVSYPDLVVICGEPQYHDEFRDVILNPQVIIEVLSDSTADFDRGDKFHRYQLWNPTLTDYLLVSQDKPRVEHFVRQDDGSWNYRVYDGLAAKFNIASIECHLDLANIFDRIEFPESEF